MTEVENRTFVVEVTSSTGNVADWTPIAYAGKITRSFMNNVIKCAEYRYGKSFELRVVCDQTGEIVKKYKRTVQRQRYKRR